MGVKTEHPLVRAVSAGDTASVKELLEAGMDPNECEEGVIGLPCLYIAAHDNHLKIARLLLNHGANVNAEGVWDNMPLRVAVMKGHVNMVKLLIERGADVNTSEVELYRLRPILTCAFVTPPHAAAPIARLLLQAGAEITPRIISRLMEHADDIKRKNVVSEIITLIAERYPVIVTDYWMEHPGPGRW